MKLDKLLKVAVAALEDIKAKEIVTLDVSRVTAMFDSMIIASADSGRQTKALASHVVEKVKAAGGTVYSTEGEDSGEWVLVDLGDVIVHIMQPAVRAHYNLEDLWLEAEAVKIKLPVAKSDATKKVVSKKVAAKKPAATKPVAKKPAVKKPLAKKPAAKKPATKLAKKAG